MYSITPEMLNVDIDEISMQLNTIIRELFENKSVPAKNKIEKIIKLPKKTT